MKRTPKRELPLRCFTADTWALRALESPLSLLNDHAHLEKKAASNALDLLPCWPEPKAHPRWVKILSGISVDEVKHLSLVVRILERRGGAMSRAHKNPYAQALRTLVRKGQGPLEIADRLMISALIEARSCERFALLADATNSDPELHKMYTSLWGSEFGHYKVFLELAEHSVSSTEAKRRWDFMLEAEAKIIKEQSGNFSMHGWA